jgi:hypothetical protein
VTDLTDIIRQIQIDLTSSQIRLESILLKAKVLAHYLQNNELKKWVKNELDGYPDKDNLPDYRIINATIVGKFFNGVYLHSHKPISVSNIAPELRESANKVYVLEGVVSVEEMSKLESFCNYLPGDWIDYYNVFNAETLRFGHYQLIEAYRPLMGTFMAQILGIIRNRLLDFVLEISNLSWDMLQDTRPVDQINRIIQITIYHNSGELNMSNFQQKDGDIYNVGQAGSVGRYASSNGNTFIQSEQKKTLAEAAAEIQNLLKQLEQSNPAATESDQITYVNDETAPSFKRRLVSALQGSSETAIDEYVLESKWLKVVKAAIKGWLQPAS